jgi:hypothetical protein
LSRNNAIELLEKMPIKDATLLFGAVLGTRTIDPNAGKGEHCSYAPTAEELIRYVGGVDKFVDGGKKALEIYNLLEKRRMYPSTLNWREFVKDPSSQNKNRLLSW